MRKRLLACTMAMLMVLTQCNLFYAEEPQEKTDILSETAEGTEDDVSGAGSLSDAVQLPEAEASSSAGASENADPSQDEDQLQAADQPQDADMPVVSDEDAEAEVIDEASAFSDLLPTVDGLNADLLIPEGLIEECDPMDEGSDALLPEDGIMERSESGIDLSLTLPTLTKGMTKDEMKAGTTMDPSDLTLEAWGFNDIQLADMETYHPGATLWCGFLFDVNVVPDSITVNEETIPVYTTGEFYYALMNAQSFAFCDISLNMLLLNINVMEAAQGDPASVTLPTLSDGMDASQIAAAVAAQPEGLSVQCEKILDDNGTEISNYHSGDPSWVLLRVSVEEIPSVCKLNDTELDYVYADDEMMDYAMNDTCYAVPFADSVLIYAFIDGAPVSELEAAVTTPVLSDGITAQQVKAQAGITPDSLTISDCSFLEDDNGESSEFSEDTTKWLCLEADCPQVPAKVTLNGTEIAVTRNGIRKANDLENGDTDFAYYHDEKLTVYEYAYDTVPKYAVNLVNAGDDPEGDGNYRSGRTVYVSAGFKSGYRFTEWTTEDGITLEDPYDRYTSFVMPDHDVTLTANWEEDVYTITFDANGGSVDPASAQTNEFGQLSSLPVPKHDSIYTFDGWYFDNSKYSDRVYANDTGFEEDITIYAHWKINRVEYDAFEVPTWGAEPDFGIKIPENVHYHMADGQELREYHFDVPDDAVNGTWWYEKYPSVARAFLYPDDHFEHADSKYYLYSVIMPDEGYSFADDVEKVFRGDASGMYDFQSYAQFCSFESILFTVTEPVTVRFDANGGQAETQELTAGEDGKLSDLPIPTFGDHVFSGWYTGKLGGERIEEDHVYTQSTTLYAHWDGYEPEGCEIALHPNGGSLDTTVLTTDAQGYLPYLPTPTHEEAYVFDGWYTSKTGDVKVDSSTVFDADVELYAHWKIIYAELNDFTKPRWHAHPDFDLSVPEDAHYHLASRQEAGIYLWNMTDNYNGSYWNIKWGKNLSPDDIFEDDTYVMSTVLIPDWGYFFANEFLALINGTTKYVNFAGNGGDGEGEIDTIYFELHSPVIRFDANGGTVASESVQTNQDGFLYDLPVPEFEGYLFKGWYTQRTGGEEVDSETEYQEDTTLYAHWEGYTPAPAASVQITCDPNGGQLAETSFTTNEKGCLDPLPVPEHDTYVVFNGWYTEKAGGSEVTTDTVFAADATIYAHWLITKAEVNGFVTPTWNASPNFNLTVPEDVPYHLATAQEMEDLEWKPGAVNGVYWNYYYSFYNYGVMDEHSSFNREDMNYYAEIVLIGDPGYEFSEQCLAYLNGTTLQIYYDLLTAYKSGQGYIRTVDFQVQEPKVQYKTTVIYGGLSAYGSGSYGEGETVTVNAGTKSGYVFDGWSSDPEITFADPENAITTFTMPAQDVTVTASWKKQNSYTVRFDANGHGTAPGQQKIPEGGKAYMPPVPTAVGYRFLGWFTESECTNQWNFKADPVDKDTTLFAKWEKEEEPQPEPEPQPQPTTHSHVWNAGVIRIQPTEDAPGQKVYQCVCGEEYTEEIPKTVLPVTVGKTIKSPKVSTANTKVTVSWAKDDKTLKKYKNISGIEVQVATDPEFRNIIQKSTVGKKKVKTTFRGKKKTTYWVRIRYRAKDGVSSWKTKKVKVK